MTTESVPRPLQVSTDLSRPYWEAAREGRLLLQQCSICQALRHYPRLLCSHCHSEDFTWREASRRGQVHSWTVAHHPFHPSFSAEVPYTLVTVDLEEGPRALGRWIGDTPVLGQRVVGRFERRDAGVDLVFKKA
ncbi:MAG: Zn-ribbon domain-containing OB-fold protein [Betaproteobacteria bacterium]